MPASVYYTWQCSHCGHVNRFLLKDVLDFAPADKKIIATCDCDEGGCDKDYAIFIHVEVRTEILSQL